MSRSKRKATVSRRQALGLVGSAAATAATNPLSWFLNGIVDGMVNKALAQSTVEPRNYIHFYTYGSYTPWYLMPLTPFNMQDPNFRRTRMIATAYGPTGPEYKVFPYQYGPNNSQTIYFPALWGSTDPVSGQTFAQKLAPYFLGVRGVKLGTTVSVQADHVPPFEMYPDFPINSALTVEGCVGDASSRPFGRVTSGAQQQDAHYSDYYRSRLSSQAELGGTLQDGVLYREGGASVQPLNELLRSFQYSSDESRQRALFDMWNSSSLVDAARTALSQYARDNRHFEGADRLYAASANARRIIASQLTNLSQDWDGIYRRYRDLIQLAFGFGSPSQRADGALRDGGRRPSIIPNCTDYPVLNPGLSSNDASIALTTGGCRYNNEDLRTAIADGSIAGEPATIACQMAEGFALAEWSILNQMTSALTVSLGQWMMPNGVSSPQIALGNLYRAPGSETSEVKAYHFDSHYSGVFGDIVCMSAWGRAFLTCLVEFFRVLELNHLTDSTVVQLGGEFGRYATDSYGTGHSCWSSNLMCWSGAVSGPICIGNIAKDPVPDPAIAQYQNVREGDATSSAGAGTYGFTSLTQKPDGSTGYITSAERAATLAELLRVESPVPAASVNRLVAEDASGKYTQRIANAVNKPFTNTPG